MVVRIATWNIDRSGVRGKWRAAEQAQLLESLQANICVITEVHESFELAGRSAMHLSAPGTPPSYKPADRAVGIWSSLPLVQKIPTTDARLAACVEVESELGLLLVYGTILPYRDEGRALGLESWEAHRRACQLQLDDWQSLRERFPKHHLIIAGDFNMTLGECNTYVDPPTRTKLLDGTARLGLRCLTEQDLRSVVGRANIDHVFVSQGLRLSGAVQAWMGTSQKRSPKLLSDHNGVCVDIALPVGAA